MNDQIQVTVCCLSFNHEKYMRKTIESIVKQKTDFKFEIIIHDDCSTDSSQSIIKEYQAKYPSMIKTILQKENQFSQGKNILRDILFPNAKGKYVAFCECDDYWTDENKLQKQYNIMEKNCSCSISVHSVQYVNEIGEEMMKTKPSQELKSLIVEGILSAKYLFNNVFVTDTMPFQTASFFMRKEYIDDFIVEKPKFSNIKNVGDLPLLWYLISKGNLYYINEELSVYRFQSEGSWSQKMITDNEFLINHYKDLIKYFEDYDEFSNHLYKSVMKELKLLHQFEVNKLSGICKPLLKNEYKKIFKKQSVGTKCKIIICACFPQLYPMMKKYKESRR